MVRRPAGGARRLSLELPVEAGDTWRDANVMEDIGDALGFLTGDVWSLDVRPIARPRRVRSIHIAGLAERLHSVSLFSGGLDSLAGAVQQLASHGSDRIALVNVGSGPRMGAARRELLRRWHGEFGDRVRAVSVRFHVEGGARYRMERSQRSRGFLFAAVGAVVASCAGLAQFQAYENGIGAINLAYESSCGASIMSRSTRPFWLKRCREVLSRILREDVRGINPFLGLTKGEVCRSLCTRGALARVAVSCDRAEGRTAHARCGTCTSCVLSTIGLAAAGLQAPPFAVSPEQWPSLKPCRLAGARAMHFQVEQLRQAPNGSEPWAVLRRRFPELSMAAAAASMQPSAGLALYRRYVREWDDADPSRILRDCAALEGGSCGGA